MKLLTVVLGFFLLSACVTRQVERETVVQPPSRVEVVPAPAPAAGTTVVVPR
jgi:hypothetical protein